MLDLIMIKAIVLGMRLNIIQLYYYRDQVVTNIQLLACIYDCMSEGQFHVTE